MQNHQLKASHVMLALAMLSTAVYAEDASNIELSDIKVISTTPLHGAGLPANQIASNIQSATAEGIEKSQSLDLTDFLNKKLTSVSINVAQNNPFQPDLQFRGFTASPLVGVAQGLSVYQDGVRINEPFGDAVNFELIPESAISNLNLIPGSNPAFGLNTLGGTISIQTKNGFTHQGHSLEAYGGSFGRKSATLESGANDGSFGYFITGAHTEEEGWRDESPSRINQLFANTSYRNKSSTLDLATTAVKSDLNGNGATPIELLKKDRKAVFTYPDNTQNDLLMVSLNGSHWFSDSVLLSANTYHRNNDRDTFNGDGAELEFDADGDLVEEDETEKLESTKNKNISKADLGNPDDDDLALNNTSTTEQDGYGFNAQVTLLNDLFEQKNQLIVGFSYDKADMQYNAQSEVAVFKRDRGTEGKGVILQDTVVDADIDSDSMGIFFTDTLSVTDQLALTLSARYNLTRIDISGTSRGGNTKINEGGDTHKFKRINPAVGLAYTANENLGVYGSYSESSRAPTPSELACSNKNDPCAFPNAFLSDPPLDQVIAKTWEAGLRGQLKSVVWTVGVFRTINKDDIIFLPTGDDDGDGRLNLGYFDNISETKRQGVELGFNGALVADKLTWFASYSYIDATFEDTFKVHNENNPAGETTTVSKGDNIPGIPKHNIKIGADYALTPSFTLGFNASYHSSQYYRGDEANNNDQLSGYYVANIHGRYNLTQHIEIFAKIDNLFDREYETFGLYGEPDEAPGLGDLEDTRFVGAGAPRAGWIGIKISM